METSGRPAAVFRPEIINQLGVVEIVLHSLRQLRLSNGNKEGPCSVLDCITRPECEQGGTIKSVELEKVNGILIWSIDVAQPGKKDLTDV